MKDAQYLSKISKNYVGSFLPHICGKTEKTLEREFSHNLLIPSRTTNCSIFDQLTLMGIIPLATEGSGEWLAYASSIETKMMVK